MARAVRRLQVTSILGTVLIWAVLGIVGYIGGWTIRAHRGQSQLVDKVSKQIKREKREGSCRAVNVTQGQLAGVIKIPALNLSAPVEEGIKESILSVAVGHAPQSQWPGQGGIAVFLAHDVSYFARIDTLKPGDEIIFSGLVDGCKSVVYKVVGHQIVPAGAPIYPLSSPSLVLDTCWPVNALWFTPNRYLLRAVEVGVKSATNSQARPVHVKVGASYNGDLGQEFKVPAPSALVAQGLTLQQNEVPMGTMTVSSSALPAWTQSPQPMDLEAAGLEEYFGAWHALAARNASWWSDLTKGVSMPENLAGAVQSAHYSGLDVYEKVDGLKPEQVVLSTDVGLNGPGIEGQGMFSVTVTETVINGSLYVTGFQVVPH
jgi:sortase A